MAIEKKGTRYTPKTSEVSPQDVAEVITGEPVNERKVPVMLRFDPGLLKRVDVTAKKRGLSRSGWIHYVVSRAVEEGKL
jgi:hypothetical protein